MDGTLRRKPPLPVAPSNKDELRIGYLRKCRMNLQLVVPSSHNAARTAYSIITTLRTRLRGWDVLMIWVLRKEGHCDKLFDMKLAFRSMCSVFAILLLCGCAAAAPMQSVRVASDNKGFVLSPSGDRFLAWGHNYAAEGLDDSNERAWAKIDSDLNDLKSIGTNVIRVHLQFPRFMDGPAKPNAGALAGLGRLLKGARPLLHDAGGAIIGVTVRTPSVGVAPAITEDQPWLESRQMN